MSSSSPGVRRVVAILNFIAEHPGQSFTLTDIVKALKLSRGTCHALLTGLVEAGYLYRTSDKSYVLGPALAVIGRTADSHFSPLQAAIPEMRALADEYDVVCSAISRQKNDVVVFERATSRSHLGWMLPRGTRMPLRPPFGGIFFAWSKPAKVEAWLDQLNPPPPPQFREQMHAVMKLVRHVGFEAVIANKPSHVETDWFFGDAQIEPPVRVVAELEADTEYEMTSVNAPVFDEKSEVAFVVALSGFEGLHTGARVESIGQKLRTACERITQYMGGRQPPLR
jgi:DNA-binding IclR family transcriptional regulator